MLFMAIKLDLESAGIKGHSVHFVDVQHVLSPTVVLLIGRQNHLSVGLTLSTKEDFQELSDLIFSQIFFHFIYY